MTKPAAAFFLFSKLPFFSVHDNKHHIHKETYSHTTSYKLAITNNTIKATDLKQVKDANGAPLKTFDPGYMNTTCCISRISFIDGDKGILRYRGIPIEQLAAQSNYLEVAYLLNYGNLPDASQLKSWNTAIMEHVHVLSHEKILYIRLRNL